MNPGDPHVSTRHTHIPTRRTRRGEIVLQQLVVVEERSPDVREEQEDFLVWSGCSCGCFRNIGIEPAEGFDAPFGGAGVFDTSPAA